MTAASILFNPVGPIWLVLFLLFVLSVFFIRNEIRRKLGFLWLRIAAQTVALIAVAGLALHPANQHERFVSPILLLTKNYNSITVDSLLAKNSSVEVLRIGEATAFRSARQLEGWSELSSLTNRIRFVAGEGIPTFALDLMPVKNFLFLPASPVSGISRLLLKPFYVNRKNIMQGTYRAGDTKTWLRLEGPGGPEDSVQIQPRQNQSFSLSFYPREPGKILYYLTVLEERKSPESEHLPLEILPEKKLNVLFLQQYPTAEIRYLKNYLSDRHHSVILRYRISQNQFRYEYSNRASAKVDHLNTETLRPFDLVIIDNESLDHLPAGEKTFLKESIRAGLGVIVTGAKSPGLFPGPEYGKAPADTATVVLPSGEKIILPLLPATLSPENFEDVLAPARNLHFSGFMYSGEGKIGFLFLQETYSLQLKGQALAYTEIWAPLIERVARTKKNIFKINIDEFPRRTNDPVRVEIISSGQKPDLFADNIRVPLKEDERIDDLWHGRIWTSPVGWHSLMIPSDSDKVNFYVSGEKEWQSLILAQQLRINGNFLSNKTFTQNQIEKIIDEIPSLIFFTLFLLASGTLWLLPKL